MTNTASEALADALVILPLIISTVAITLHTAGTYLILCLRRQRNQDLIILNLSIAEIFMAVLDIAQNLLTRFDVTSFKTYVIIINCCLFTLPSFLVIILLTVDKFLEVYFNIKYHMYFNKRKVIALLVTCWLVGLLTGIPLILLKWLKDTKVELILYLWMFPLYQGAFITIGTISYSYIYVQYRKRTSQPKLGKFLSVAKKSTHISPPKLEAQHGIKRSKQTNVFCLSLKKIYPHSKETASIKTSVTQTKPMKRRNFFAPTLIIFTFLLFVTLPDMINMVYFYLWENNSTTLRQILLCLYALGYTADAVIYIFLQNHVRRLFMKKFCRRKSVENSSRESTSHME